MAIALGKDAVTSLPGIDNDNIINVTETSEGETIDISARGHGGWKAADVGFKTKTIEVECLAHSCTVGESGAWVITSIATNEPLDGPVTYTVSFRPKAT